ALVAIVSAVLWRARRPLIQLARRLQMPERMDLNADRLNWLLVFNAIVVALIIVSVFWIEVVFDRATLRTLASLALVAQLSTFALMAEGERRRELQRTAIAVFLAGLVFLGW